MRQPSDNGIVEFRKACDGSCREKGFGYSSSGSFGSQLIVLNVRDINKRAETHRDRDLPSVVKSAAVSLLCRLLDWFFRAAQ